MPHGTVDDPRQNQHRWWGTLNIPGKPDMLHVFIKTSREAHFVIHGTVVEADSLGDVTAHNMAERLQSAKIDKAVIETLPISSVVAEVTAHANATGHGQINYCIIRSIDPKETSPLIMKLNEYTRELFQKNDTWLDDPNHRDIIGTKNIRSGMKLPPL